MPDHSIRVGIGGWMFEPWRGVFYPKGLAHKRELEFAASQLTSIEVNGTFYRTQTPDTFAKWYDETPEDFIFALKGPRYATNRRILSEAGPSIERFLNSGILLLRQKLGPINWQFAPTKQFDPEDFAGFLELLPKTVDGQPIRHAVEVRHDSFRTPAFVALARQQGVAIVIAGDSSYPQIADLTAPFVYCRIMGATEAGYPAETLDKWVARARLWASGKPPKDLEYAGSEPAATMRRDVFLYVISGFKARNPEAAMTMIRHLADHPASR